MHRPAGGHLHPQRLERRGFDGGRAVTRRLVDRHRKQFRQRGIGILARQVLAARLQHEPYPAARYRLDEGLLPRDVEDGRGHVTEHDQVVGRPLLHVAGQLRTGISVACSGCVGSGVG